MEGFRRRLPPVTALVVFEAAARRLSFTRAAAELGVTQAAVSRRIHALERALGFDLFRRLHRRVELTERGRTLAELLSQSFERIAQTIATMQAPSAEDELVIGATIAFTQLWLLPRLAEFRRLHPRTRLRLVTQDTPIDLERDLVDVVIRYGEGTWPDGRSLLLCEDDVFPVCSPSYAAGRDLPTTAAGLAEQALLDFEPAHPGWIGWQEWLAAFAAAGHARAGMRLSSYIDVIHAALAGHGVALGWNLLVGSLLRQGRLRRLTDLRLHTRGGYFVVTSNRQPPKPSAIAFVAWLTDRLRDSAAPSGRTPRRR
jgi:DNA-binding transcriptional LysR family regulator